ncbi:MAG: shikimate kinase [Solirubrobacteraceae bacterium]
MSAAVTRPRCPIRHIALVGLMGVGKTTVGRLLAGALHWSFADSDAAIEAREGASVREIQRRHGAPALHALEAAVLLEALGEPGPSVICAAASTIEEERCRRALGQPDVRVVWLSATLETMVARYDRDPHRPRYDEGTRGALAAQLAARAALYTSVAAMTIESDALAPAAIAAAIEQQAAGWAAPG